MAHYYNDPKNIKRQHLEFRSERAQVQDENRTNRFCRNLITLLQKTLILHKLKLKGRNRDYTLDTQVLGNNSDNQK